MSTQVKSFHSKSVLQVEYRIITLKRRHSAAALRSTGFSRVALFENKRQAEGGDDSYAGSAVLASSCEGRRHRFRRVLRRHPWVSICLLLDVLRVLWRAMYLFPLVRRLQSREPERKLFSNAAMLGSVL